MEDELKAVWIKLCAKYTSDAVLTEEFWQEIKQAYTSKGRHYHTLAHILYMLQQAENYKDHTPQFDELQFAIFYHDIIYKSTRSDNEEQSALLAAERLHKIGLQDDAVNHVKAMILATKLHQNQKDTTNNLLLDLDLAILGSDWPTYDAYRKGVRKEYKLYPNIIYKPGRIKVLKHFLEQPHIYKTELFINQLEDKARENLRKELEELFKV